MVILFSLLIISNPALFSKAKEGPKDREVILEISTLGYRIVFSIIRT